MSTRLVERSEHKPLCEFILSAAKDLETNLPAGWEPVFKPDSSSLCSSE